MDRDHPDPTLTRHGGPSLGVAPNIVPVRSIRGCCGIRTTSFAAMLDGVTGTVKQPGLFGAANTTLGNVMTIGGIGKIVGETIQSLSALAVDRGERAAHLAGTGASSAHAVGRTQGTATVAA